MLPLLYTHRRVGERTSDWWDSPHSDCDELELPSLVLGRPQNRGIKIHYSLQLTNSMIHAEQGSSSITRLGICSAVTLLSPFSQWRRTYRSISMMTSTVAHTQSPPKELLRSLAFKWVQGCVKLLANEPNIINIVSLSMRKCRNLNATYHGWISRTPASHASYSYDGGAQKINRGGHKYAGADVVCYESYTSTSSIMPNLCVMPAASQIYN